MAETIPPQDATTSLEGWRRQEEEKLLRCRLDRFKKSWRFSHFDHKTDKSRLSQDVQGTLCTHAGFQVKPVPVCQTLCLTIQRRLGTFVLSVPGKGSWEMEFTICAP